MLITNMLNKLSKNAIVVHTTMHAMQNPLTILCTLGDPILLPISLVWLVYDLI